MESISAFSQGASHTWYRMQGRVVQLVSRMLMGNRVGVGLTRSTISIMLPYLFSVKGASK